MNKILLLVVLTCLLTACGDGMESTAASDSTTNTNNTSPPSTVDTSVMGRMMGDTTRIMGDSTK